MPVAIEIYLAFIAACFVMAVVPGPTVTVIIANSLAHGPRAGLLNVAGTQAGLLMMLVVLAVGLASIIETMAWWFDWVRLAGALYLVWIGIGLLRSKGEIGRAPPGLRASGSFFWQGLVVVLANPKALLFFGAFLPQFIDPTRDYLAQTAFLGITLMVVAALSDGAYAVVAGAAGRSVSAARLQMVSRVSGLFLIGGGIWLALLRR